MIGLQALAYRLLAYVVIALALYAGGRFHQMLIDERERDAAIIEAWQQGDRHVAAYFKKAQALADARVVADRLRGLCGSVRGAGDAHGAARADADDRPADDIDRLASDLRACQRNRYKLEALQAVIEPQLTR